MKINEIMEFITCLRKTKKKVITNYYLSLQKSKEDFVTWKSESSIVFCAQENKVLRCYFASTDVEELNTLLEKVPEGAVLDYVVKGKMENFSWEKSGFEHYKTQIRHTTPDLLAPHPKTEREQFLEQLYQEDFGEFATAEDADELYDLLYQIFDYRVSRLPSKEELLEQIGKNWVLLYRENGEIVSFLMYQMEGKKYYGYQIYNAGTADISYNLNKRALSYAIEHYGAKSSYSWTNIDNRAANRIVDENSTDGTYNYIFVKTWS